jgi:antitoxin (DNA-binding transcriptional repressor) of toxin-antitoxin stability system
VTNLDDVCRGETIRVIQGGRALAEIAPIADAPVIAHVGRGKWRDVKLPECAEPEIDIVKYVLEDRGR